MVETALGFSVRPAVRMKKIIFVKNCAEPPFRQTTLITALDYDMHQLWQGLPQRLEVVQ